MAMGNSARIIQKALLVLLAASGTVAADAPMGGSGTWQKHEYSFVSMGFTSTYSCDGLADQLKRLLLAAGARADAKAQAGPCAADFGHPEKLARANLVFYTLLPDSADHPAAGPHVDGAWRPVVLTYKSPRELGLGDCELVEQFRAQLLPMFATRGIEDQTTCIPHQESGSVINLKFESFAAVPTQPPR
jgi:hypothetical protein